MVLILLIPLVFLAVGGFFVYLGFRGGNWLHRTRSWLSTSVTVKQLEVKEEGGSEPSYDAVVQYEYWVEGVAYQGLSITTCESYGDAQRFLNNYSGSQPVTVHYNPANPQESVLSGTTFVPTFIVGVLLFMGVGFLIIGLPMLCFMMLIFVLPPRPG